MARKTARITIEADGRDQGKVFGIREMPASQAEKWAARAFLALARSGANVPDHALGSGLAGIAAIAAMGLRIFSSVAFVDAEPLMDEMFACISIHPDPAHPQVVRALIEDDIEEVATRLKLRDEVMSLHLGFSLAAYLSKSMTGLAAIVPDFSTTPTSPAQ